MYTNYCATIILPIARDDNVVRDVVRIESLKGTVPIRCIPVPCVNIEGLGSPVRN